MWEECARIVRSPFMKGPVARVETDFVFMHLVAMHDPALMGDGQRRGRALHDKKRRAQRQRTLGQVLRQIVPIKPLHRQKELSLGSLAMGDISDDGRVVQLGEDLGFAGKPRDLVATTGLCVQKL